MKLKMSHIKLPQFCNVQLQMSSDQSAQFRKKPAVKQNRSSKIVFTSVTTIVDKLKPLPTTSNSMNQQNQFMLSKCHNSLKKHQKVKGKWKKNKIIFEPSQVITSTKPQKGKLRNSKTDKIDQELEKIKIKNIKYRKLKWKHKQQNIIEDKNMPINHMTMITEPELSAHICSRSKTQIANSIEYTSNFIKKMKQKTNQNRHIKKTHSKPFYDDHKEELFSYLKRDIFNKIKSPNDISIQQIQKYYQNPSNPYIEHKVLEKSRRQLKEKLIADYQNYKLAHQYTNMLSKQEIMRQIQQKYNLYHQQYGNKKNSGYFSYLMLSSQEKYQVLRSIHKKKSKISFNRKN